MIPIPIPSVSPQAKLKETEAPPSGKSGKSAKGNEYTPCPYPGCKATSWLMWRSKEGAEEWACEKGHKLKKLV